MTVSLRSTPADQALAQFHDTWRDLAKRVPQSTFFMHPTVFAAWHSNLSNNAPCTVISAHSRDRLVAVLPMVSTKVVRGPSFAPRIDYLPADRKFAPGQRRLFPYQQLSSVVSWPATSIRPTLLVDPEHHRDVVFAFAEHFAGCKGIDQIVLPVLEDSSVHWAGGLQSAGLRPWVHDLGRKVLTIENLRPFAAITAEQSSNFRRNIKRARKAAKLAGLRFETHAGYDAVFQALPKLDILAAQSWKALPPSDTRVTIPYEGDQARFFGDILERKDPTLTPVVVLAVADDQPVSGCLCFLHGSTVSGLIMFHNNRLPKASPGLMMLEPLIDWALNAGATRLDLNATQDWLRHLADTQTRFVNVLAFRPTFRGHCFGLVKAAAEKLRR